LFVALFVHSWSLPQCNLIQLVINISVVTFHSPFFNFQKRKAFTTSVIMNMIRRVKMKSNVAVTNINPFEILAGNVGA
jgi:hypothetical protein